MNLGGITKPVTDLAGKAAKANKIKSIKLKVKFGKQDGRVSDLSKQKPSENQ